jgi:hypothetical protein
MFCGFDGFIRCLYVEAMMMFRQTAAKQHSPHIYRCIIQQQHHEMLAEASNISLRLSDDLVQNFR